MDNVRDNDVAIIGMGCRFPGADNPEGFWSLLTEGQTAVAEVPADRWDLSQFYSKQPHEPFKTSSRWGGFLSDIEQFDPEFFGITPREAETLDPQQRLLLEVVWESLENAGVVPETLAGTDTGVFVGACKAEYWELHKRSSAGFVSSSVTGADLGMLPNRISYTLDLRGPSIVLDTLCSSSLVSVHYACQSLKQGECNVALAGGVNLVLLPDAAVALSQSQALSPTGDCKTFDKAADGYVRGEGCGMVVLKRYQDAITDGDQVLAVVRGSAINQDGRSNGISAPSRFAQKDLLERTYASAGIDLKHINYLECHGTGTPLGDPIEVNAIRDVFASRLKEDQPLTLGAAKANIGHLEAAAGIAGLIKLVLMMKHHQIPAQPNFEELNPRINMKGLRICSELSDWPMVSAEARYGAISAFSFGGVNAHMVLQQPQARVSSEGQGREIATSDTPGCLTLSAHHELSLRALASNYAALLRQDQLSVNQVAAALAAWRQNDYPHRIACTGRSNAEVAAALEGFAADPSVVTPGLWRRGSYSKRQKVAFLFTGQGAQYPGMGKTLYSQYESFRSAIDRCAAYLLQAHDVDIVPILFSDQNVQDIHHTLYTQPALFVYEYALTCLLADYEVKPGVVLGHSVGEYVAACVAGYLSLEDALTLITLRARGMANQCETGAMLAVFSTPQTALSAIEALGDELDIAALNAPELFVFSGDASIIEKAAALLEASGIRSRRLEVSHAFHSRMMEPMLPEFTSALQNVSFCPPTLALISNVTGKVLSPEEMTPDYWAKHIRQPVNFVESVRELEEVGVTTVIEIGPAAVLSGLCRQCELNPGIAVIPAVRTGRNEQENFVEALAQLFVAGCAVKPPTNGCIDILSPSWLPLYPFNRRPFWLQGLPAYSLTPPSLDNQSSQALLGASIDIAGTRDRYYQSTVLTDLSRYLEDHRVDGTVVFPGAAYIDLMLTALKDNDFTQCAIKNIELIKPLLLTEETCLQTRLLFSSESSEFEQCEVWAKERDSVWQRYARATVLAGSLPTKPSPSTTQNSGLNIAEHYQWLASIGLDYGARFQGMRTAQLKGGEAIGTVALPEQTHFSVGSAIHPVLLDSALHLVTVAIRQQVMPTTRLVPASIKTAWFDGAKRDSATVVATITEVADANGAVIADVYFYDENGLCVGACVGVRAVPMGKIEVARTVPLYQPVWALQGLSQKSLTCERLVVTAPDRLDLAQTMARRSDEQTSIVMLGCATEQTAMDGITLIDRQNPNAWAELLCACDAVSEVILLSPGQRETVDAEIASAESLFQFFKAWLASPLAARTDLSLKLVTSRVQAVAADDEPCANGSSWVGLTGVFATESGNIRCTIVDLESTHDDQQLQQLFSEPGRTHNPVMVAYRGQQRLVRQLRQIHIPKLRPDLKPRGVYVVLGGAGGLGRLLSEELSKHYHAKIVWLGRRPNDCHIKASMAEVTMLGGSVTYLQVDATDAEALSAALNGVRDTLGAISGVVHAAAVVDDSAMENMSDDQMRKVLVPKIRASINLAEATRKDKLDIFAFFSSAASFGFNAGQANYVAGGTFIDALSRELAQRGVPAITLNWGYWGELGVSNRTGLGELMHAQGIEPISAEEGRSTLLRLLNPELGQAMPIKASDELLAQWGLPVDAVAPAGPEQDLPDSMLQQLSEVARRLNKAQSCDCILGFLKLQVARIMKSRESDIDSPANPFKQLSLSVIGFESLMIMDLRGRIQRYLDVTLSSEELLKKEDMGQITEAIYEQILLRQLSTEDEAEEEGSDMETFVI